MSQRGVPLTPLFYAVSQFETDAVKRTVSKKTQSQRQLGGSTLFGSGLYLCHAPNFTYSKSITVQLLTMLRTNLTQSYA